PILARSSHASFSKENTDKLPLPCGQRTAGSEAIPHLNSYFANQPKATSHRYSDEHQGYGLPMNSDQSLDPVTVTPLRTNEKLHSGFVPTITAPTSSGLTLLSMRR
ncbi:MAG: hypothetical protein WA970_02770, partial [Gammaproteobacteria bacterium]